MWMLNQLLQAAPVQEPAQMGKITGAANVQTQTDYAGVQMCAPWGVRWRAPDGTRAVLLKTEDGVVCTGVPFDGTTLQPGELLLCAEGGAQIYLKANGEVVINGQTFPAVKQERANGNSN